MLLFRRLSLSSNPVRTQLLHLRPMSQRVGPATSLPVLVPDLSGHSGEAVLTNWHRRQGEWVEQGDVLCDLEGEKVTFDIRAPSSGYLTIHVEEGTETISTGKRIASINPNEEKALLNKSHLPGEYISFGFKTVLDGEKVAIWDNAGRCRIESGPKRIFVVGKSVEPLSQIVVDAKRYVQILYKDGRVENLRGPATVGFDPTQHKSVTLHQLVTLINNEVLVTYQKGETSIVKRQLITGPTSHMPAPNEYIQSFRWTGSSGIQSSFTKLETTLRQILVKATNVRTQDNAILSIQLMVFLQLVDVDQMLSSTHDPMASFQDSFTADVLEFSSNYTFQEWRGKGALLNDLETYPQALRMAQSSGFQIQKVVFRGFGAERAISEMMENSLKRQTEIKLADEENAQKQKSLDVSKKASLEREIQNNVLAKTNLLQRNELDQLVGQGTLTVAENQHQQDFRHARELAELDLQKRKTELQAQLEFYQSLHSTMSVDITKLLTTSKNPRDKNITFTSDDKLIQPIVKFNVSNE